MSKLAHLRAAVASINKLVVYYCKREGCTTVVQKCEGRCRIGECHLQSDAT